MSIDTAINNAAASVEMEGYSIDEQCKYWCRQVLENKITMEQYIQLVLEDVNIHIQILQNLWVKFVGK